MSAAQPNNRPPSWKFDDPTTAPRTDHIAVKAFANIPSDSLMAFQARTHIDVRGVFWIEMAFRAVAIQLKRDYNIELKYEHATTSSLKDFSNTVNDKSVYDFGATFWERYTPLDPKTPPVHFRTTNRPKKIKLDGTQLHVRYTISSSMSADAPALKLTCGFNSQLIPAPTSLPRQGPKPISRRQADTPGR